MAQAGAPALVVALGAGGLIGGLAGALIASALGASGPSSAALAARVAGPEPIEPVENGDDERLELLLGTLIDEVRALSTSPGRQSADAVTDDSRDLIAAIEELTAAVRRAGSGSGGAVPLGGGLTTIDFPQGAARIDLLLERESVKDEHERVRPYLLWNYQQVLDHFGPPSAIWPDDRWMYEVPATGEQVEFHFQYGLLINIY